MLVLSSVWCVSVVFIFVTAVFKHVIAKTLIFQYTAKKLFNEVANKISVRIDLKIWSKAFSVIITTRFSGKIFKTGNDWRPIFLYYILKLVLLVTRY